MYNLINYWHYFFVNLCGFNFVPNIITYNGFEWFNVLSYEEGQWYLVYSRFVNKTETEVAFEVMGKSRYKVFLKMVRVLWKNRKNVDFIIDNY